MTIPACTNCRWRDGDDEYAKCNAPKLVVLNPMLGEFEPRLAYCSYQRDAPWPFHYFTGTCGRSGRWFEARSEEKSR